MLNDTTNDKVSQLVFQCLDFSNIYSSQRSSKDPDDKYRINMEEDVVAREVTFIFVPLTATQSKTGR